MISEVLEEPPGLGAIVHAATGHHSYDQARAQRALKGYRVTCMVNAVPVIVCERGKHHRPENTNHSQEKNECSWGAIT